MICSVWWYTDSPWWRSIRLCAERFTRAFMNWCAPLVKIWTWLWITYPWEDTSWIQIIQCWFVWRPSRSMLWMDSFISDSFVQMENCNSEYFLSPHVIPWIGSMKNDRRGGTELIGLQWLQSVFRKPPTLAWKNHSNPNASTWNG